MYESKGTKVVPEFCRLHFQIPEPVLCCDVGPMRKNIESTLEEVGLAAYGRW